MVSDRTVCDLIRLGDRQSEFRCKPGDRIRIGAE